MPNPVMYELQSERLINGQHAKPNMVHFEEDTRENRGLTKAAGRPIHDRVVKAFIHSPGQQRSEACHVVAIYTQDGTLKIDKPALDKLTKGLAEVTEKYLAGQAPAPIKGTPLSEWPGMDRRTEADLKAANILTIEQLADAGDNGLMHIFGGRDLQRRAKEYLERARENITAESLSAQNAELLERLAALEAKVADEGYTTIGVSKVEVVGPVHYHGPGAEKPKRGRPRKQEEEAA